MKTILRTLALLGLMSGVLVSAEAGSKPPEKLSDLYRLFTQAVGDGLGAKVQGWPVRIQGRSWELMKDARFPEVELVLKPFEAQDLKFEKGEILFRKLQLDRDALINWKLELREVREVQSRFIFSTRSLAAKLSRMMGQEVALKAEGEDSVFLTSRGRFLFIPCQVQAVCRLVWNDASKQLALKPVEISYGGHKIWRLFWFLGSRPAPVQPVLDFGFSWIPFNIQEVHVSWDRVNLTTNW
jgi:hypothetical protein